MSAKPNTELYRTTVGGLADLHDFVKDQVFPRPAVRDVANIN